MSDAFYGAYFALESRMKMVEVITNNLANAQTTGFKRDFGRFFEEQNKLATGSSVDLSPGDLVATRNELDAAIAGPGFFAVETPAGTRYTRNGSFLVNDAGELVTKDGLKVLDKSGSPIVPGSGMVAIQDGGIVTLDGNEVAALKIVTFEDSAQLQKEGASTFAWNGPAEGVQDVLDPRVKSGHLERSNVNAVSEMVRMISAYREFESVQRVMRTLSTEMDAKLVSELGRLT